LHFADVHYIGTEEDGIMSGAVKVLCQRGEGRADPPDLVQAVVVRKRKLQEPVAQLVLSFFALVDEVGPPQRP
jgi:hypothetical protein